VFAPIGADSSDRLGGVSNVNDTTYTIHSVGVTVEQCKWAARRVEVKVSRAGNRIQIEVNDDGSGLPEDDLERVLGRGVRLDERTAGSGLGLAIVADIAESYGGSLVLRNGTPGLQATLTLPAGLPG
jgi:signal transduction histidine kinase